MTGLKKLFSLLVTGEFCASAPMPRGESAGRGRSARVSAVPVDAVHPTRFDRRMISRFRASLLAAIGALAGLALITGSAAAQSAPADIKDALEAARAGNFSKALSELLPHARNGNAEAAYGVADLYRSGQGVKQNLSEAARWYRVAAERSHPVAQYNLAVLYTAGHGVPADMVEARHWYRMAAEQGYAPAQYNLAVVYAAGQGGPANIVQGWMWFELAAAQGHKEAAKNRDLVAAEMTPAQVAAAKELVRKWREQRTKKKKESAG